MRPGLSADTSKRVMQLLKEIQSIVQINTAVHVSPAAENVARMAAEMLSVITLAIEVNESLGVDTHEIAKLQIAAVDRAELERFIVDYIRDNS